MEFVSHPTPNPNSLKLVRADGGPMLADPDLAGAPMLTASSLGEAAQHPFTMALFAVPGVAGVFALPAFVTVTREPSADWATLLPEVEAVLRQFVAP